MDRFDTVGVRVREYLFISSSTLPAVGRVSGTMIAYSQTITLPFPPLMMKESSVLRLEAYVLNRSAWCFFCQKWANILRTKRCLVKGCENFHL